MTRRVTSWSRTGLAIAILALVAVPAAIGYEGTVAGQVSVSAPSSVTCPAPVKVTATVVDVLGKPIQNQPVIWSTGVTTSTNKNGQATTSLVVPLGGIKVTAQADQARSSAVINCKPMGLPRTDTATPAPPTPALLILLAVCLVSSILLRRRRAA